MSALDDLRRAGAQRMDPLRFHYLERLAARAAEAMPSVRAVLARKLDEALADYAARFLRAGQTAADTVARLAAQPPAVARESRRLLAAGDHQAIARLAARLAAPAAAPKAGTPLAALNRYLDDAAQSRAEAEGGCDGDSDRRGPASSGPGLPGGTGATAGVELRSVRRFREVWSRIAAEDQVQRAMVRGPGNAGPLNSQMLVLRSLALMRDLSPEYLRRFMAHAETLLWLDHESQSPAPAEARPARKGRQKKA
jgi:hypothetical protein